MIELMKEICKEYLELLEAFLSGRLRADEFQNQYLSKFKMEKRPIDDEIYEVLEAAFGDANSLTSDSELLKMNSPFYIDEAALRKGIQSRADRLLAMSN